MPSPKHNIPLPKESRQEQQKQDHTSSERKLPVVQNVELRSDGITASQQEPSQEELPATEQQQLNPGATLGENYEILEVLGSGGMGTVYRVYNRLVGAERTLKLLHEHALEDLTSTSRFQNEIAALAKLRHPGLVRLYDAGRVDNHLYYTMDLLRGGNLHGKLVSEGTFSEIKALQVLHAIARGVGYIHNKGLIHRDLKSDNIAFDDLDRPVVVDFGLALRVGLTPEERLTRRGRIVGSVHYMAPEQVQRPHEIDHRCDIYALGVLLYEMLTGDPPFATLQGSDVLVNMLAGKTPPLQQVKPELSDEIAGLCEKAMSILPDLRFQTTQELCEAIEALLPERASQS